VGDALPDQDLSSFARTSRFLMPVGNTTLHTIADSAFHPWSSHLVELLLENGANLQILNRAGETALGIAAKERDRAIQKIILDAWLQRRTAGPEYNQTYRGSCGSNRN
jgi:hypothetical protein